ncbi:MAG TPA: hypothetical protein PLL23_06425 [Chitinophagaceae bacterium]|nr:hypothetical protein [Chitinophagaceae bacterium]
MSPFFSSILKVCLALALVCSIGPDCLANDPVYISPFGNNSYYKKRSSEKDFSFSPDYDFSMQFIRLGTDEFLRITNWKNKRSTERLVTSKNKLSSEDYYLNSNGQTRLLKKGGVILAYRAAVEWMYNDSETGIALQCSSRLSDTVFTGVQKRGLLTVLKKGKGLNIKEVYIEGFGLMILVINNTIYTQLMGDYDVKKDMMTTLGYTDPMGCLLVNETNHDFFKGKMKELFDHALTQTKTGRASESSIQASLLKDELKQRVLSATMTRVFSGTDYASYTEKYIAYSYSLLAGITLSSLQTETKEEEKPLLLNAHHQRLFMSPGVDFLDNKFLTGDAWVKQQQNYCRSIQQLAIAMTDSQRRHPFYEQELLYLDYLNNEALKDTWKDHPREKLVKFNQFLLEWVLALSYHNLAAQTTEPDYKNAYTKNSFKYAYNSLRNHVENKGRKETEDLILDKEIEKELVKIIDEIGFTDNATDTPDMLWLLMCHLKEYDLAFKWFKIALPNHTYMYSDNNLPNLSAMAAALNNTAEVLDLIAKNRVSNEKPATAEKSLAYLALQSPQAAIDLIKNVRWGTLEFFADEVAGQKVLRAAFKNKQQLLLDFFYNEITSNFNLTKTPKKQYNPETYERLILFSHLTEEFGNTDLSHKLYEYYQAMWKYK